MRARALLIVAAITIATPVRAEVGEASPRADDAFDFMNVLARHHLHDLQNEYWNVYGQFTWISSFKLPFSAAYTNLNGSTNSLHTGFEHSFTGTLTAFLGAKLWHGAEMYWVPEVITEHPLSGLLGLGGVIQNFELQKQGSEVPLLYSSRLYLRQTFNFGGGTVTKTSDPQQVAMKVDARRLTFTLGNFSVLDFFDKNTFAGDLRRQFFNMAFLSYAAYDFAADARGYTWGAIAELVYDDWTVRIGRAIPPKDPNQLPLDFKFWEHYGDQLEVEHAHRIRSLPGAVRVLAYRNHEHMGRFDEAIAAFKANASHNATTCTGFSYGNGNASAPDLCWSRTNNVKWGVGVNLEQAVYRDIGVFARGMYSDGQTEVYSYTSTDRSLSFGALARGSLWRRPKDFTGFGVGLGWISSVHADYLKLGGTDGFLGDGNLHPAPENVIEVFYGVNLASSVWLSGDYQHITNPGYNADRGPVNILGARFHAEF